MLLMMVWMMRCIVWCVVCCHDGEVGATVVMMEKCQEVEALEGQLHYSAVQCSAVWWSPESTGLSTEVWSARIQ